MTRGARIFFGATIPLVLAGILAIFAKRNSGEGLQAVFRGSMIMGPDHRYIETMRSYGKEVREQQYPVAFFMVTNRTSKTIRLYSNDGTAVFCEYHDKIETGWTNWRPKLETERTFFLLKPHSERPVFVRSREDGGERRADILCVTEIPTPRLPGFWGQLEYRVYSMFGQRQLTLSVTLPSSNNVAAPNTALPPR